MIIIEYALNNAGAERNKRGLLRLRLEYVCTRCGRPFGRRYSAERHLVGIHKRQGQIVSFMEYILGVIQGLYEWPSYNKRKKAFRDKLDSTSGNMTVYDSVEKFAQFSRNLREILLFASEQAELRPAVIPPAEYLLGHACGKCLTRSIVPTLNLETAKLHKCDFQRAQQVQNIHVQDKVLESLCHYLPKMLKQHLDNWIRGEKFLEAIPISEEVERSLPKHIVRLNLGRSNPEETTYFARTLRGSTDREDGWTVLTEGEVNDFLGRAWATAAIAIIQSKAPLPHHQRYILRIVPPHIVEARKRHREFNSLMKSL